MNPTSGEIFVEGEEISMLPLMILACVLVGLGIGAHLLDKLDQREREPGRQRERQQEQYRKLVNHMCDPLRKELDQFPTELTYVERAKLEQWIRKCHERLPYYLSQGYSLFAADRLVNDDEHWEKSRTQ